MTTSIRIVTTSKLDSNPCILLVGPDGSTTLVNCGEGCQRSFLESSSSIANVGGLRIRSINRICLTHISHDAVGGLPGMILTSADAKEAALSSIQEAKGKKGKEQDRKKRKENDLTEEDSALPGLDLIGPKGLQKFINSLSHFMRRDRFRICVHEGEYNSDIANSSKIWRGEGRKKQKRKKKNQGKNSSASAEFIVDSIPLTHKVPLPSAAIVHQDGNSILSQQSSPASSEGHNDHNRHFDSPLMSYIFTTPPIPGKFLVEKAKELKIPPGRLYAQLVRGETVTFTVGDEEHTVRSDQVVTKGSSGVSVAVIYCPSLSILDQLQNSNVMNKFKINSSCLQTNNNHNESKNKDSVQLFVIIHITPNAIFHSDQYKLWMDQFGPHVDHITLHPEEDLSEASEFRKEEHKNMDGTKFHAAALGAMARSLLSKDIFPPPFPIDIDTGKIKEEQTNCQTKKDPHKCVTSNQLSDTSSNTDIQRQGSFYKGSTICGRPLMEYVLIPCHKRGLNKDAILDSHVDGISQEERISIQKKVQLSGALPCAKSLEEKEQNLKNSQNEYLDATQSSDIIPMDTSTNAKRGELIFTGTGSAIPCKYRNVSGIYLGFENHNGMLLDIGEGTVGQLLRSWESTLVDHKKQNNLSIREYFRKKLRSIKAVWISHPHADHHLGILRFLSERAKIVGVSDDPIVLMAPQNMFRFLHEYIELDPTIARSYIAVDSRDMMHGRVNPLGHKLHKELGLTWCASVPVAHCANSYAIVIDGTPFGRLVYSGDCRPSDRLARVGENADLLIHEATFENGMEEEAVLKRHSTVGEALKVGQKMNTKALLLTHFSQRYPRIPPLVKNYSRQLSKTNSSNIQTNFDLNSSKVEIPIAFAFDFMRVKPNNIHVASNLTPALRLLYPDTTSNDVKENKDPFQNEGDSIVTAKDIMSVPGLFAKEGIL